ncbi:MAG: DEAD/DEAH box helicase [Nitrospinota bacterium]|nr:DEAD/DEAH box helicase [Nitrospinota bacterium]MDH3494641.1 DEAD/DEAH box helicase [Acidobacteriota bacterium]
MLTQTIPASIPGGFDTLNLISPLCRAVSEEKYTLPTPIQMEAIPHLLLGRDLLGCAQTGTGKTAAFALPILQGLAKHKEKPRPKEVRTLILTPTRELALQIDESFQVYGRYLKFNQAVVFGGVSPKAQIRALSRGVDVLVATPGRLLDLFNQGCFRMDKIEVFVLDEADQMLDMGFLPDVKKIFNAIPETRQTILFSATMPDEIVRLTHKFLNDPIRVSVSPPSRTVDKVDQRILFVDRENKSALLESILEDESVYRVLVFTRTKHGANRIAKVLTKKRIRTEAIHGNKSQSARMQALNKFRSGHVRVLVATDVASRGLDVDDITHVINYELPKEAESYVHRIGRTARAGATGIAISFCDAEERGYLRMIERTINQVVTVDKDHPYHSDAIASKSSHRGGNGNGGRRGAGNGKRSSKGFSARPGKRSSQRTNPSAPSGYGKRNQSFHAKPRQSRPA